MQFGQGNSDVVLNLLVGLLGLLVVGPLALNAAEPLDFALLAQRIDRLDFDIEEFLNSFRDLWFRCFCINLENNLIVL